MEGFWVGRWQHIVFSAEELRDNGKCPVLRQLCFGPLESAEYGVSDGEFYYENKVSEGIGEGDRFFEIIDKDSFLKTLENEIRLCRENAPNYLEQVTERINAIRERLNKL